MPGRLNGRVSRLENGSVGPCEECGGGGGEEPLDHPHGDTYEMIFDERPYDEPDEEETCSTCGRVLSTTIFFEDDLPDHERREHRG
jgi:hypothetical protein